MEETHSAGLEVTYDLTLSWLEIRGQGGGL
jgi:hypothetical protein